MTVPPEIEWLRENVIPLGEWRRVPLDVAEQAVRDAEARVRGRAENGTWPDQSAQHAVLLEQVKDARRAAFREAVEALREDAVMEAAMQHDDVAAMQRYAADFLERRFLTSEGDGDA